MSAARHLSPDEFGENVEPDPGEPWGAEIYAGYSEPDERYDLDVSLPG